METINGVEYAVHVRHASRVERITASLRTLALEFEGSKASIDAFAAALKPGTFYPGLGGLTNREVRQSGGDVWLCSCEYEQTVDIFGGFKGDGGSGPDTQKLIGRRLSLPLSRHPDYRCCWDHYLVAVAGRTDTVPAWWATATSPNVSLYTASSEWRNYKWIKSLAELPDPGNGAAWGVVHSGTIICRPTKPGVERYDYCYYTITESGRHRNKEAAGWAAATALNTIFPTPLLGDFGITARLGGDWKFDDVEIAQDGKVWVAQRTYTLSGDASGWDKDLYKPYDHGVKNAAG